MAGWKEDFDRDGFVIRRGLFSEQESSTFIDHYMAMNAAGLRNDQDGYVNDPDDPLYKFPRLLQMHREDDLSKDWMLDDRIHETLADVMGCEPWAVQTMMYFKPPQARGQALHQDNLYLRAHPGTCIGVWMALDYCDAANGCLQVVPGSHKLPLLCNIPADTTESFGGGTVPVPSGFEVVDAVMQPGDTLFFHGSLIHGSRKNVTTDRFRRCLIGHYIESRATHVWKYYFPVLRFDGTEVPLATSETGAACGVLVIEDGVERIEMAHTEHGTQKRHG